MRAVFVIDPKGVIRAIIYYPLSLGRNLDELLRVVIGLQTADAFAVATPADWRPGERVIVPTAGPWRGQGADGGQARGRRVRRLVLLHP